MLILWRILSVVAVVTLVFSILVKSVAKFKKNIYFKGYVRDQKIKESREGGSLNKYYLVEGPDSNLIPRYVLRKSVYENSIVLNYKKPYDRIVFYIACFNKDNKIIDVIEVCEENTTDTSRVIVVKRKTKHVNVIVRDCDGTRYNQSYIVPLKAKNIWISQLFNTLILFNVLFLTYLGVGQLIASSFATYYYTSFFGLIALCAIIVISAIYFFVGSLQILNKNQKERAGGKVSYEFY